MFLHGVPSRAARRRMNPAATGIKPASAGSRPGEPASAGFVLPAAGFSPPACRVASRTFRHTRSQKVQKRTAHEVLLNGYSFDCHGNRLLNRQRLPSLPIRIECGWLEHRARRIEPGIMLNPVAGCNACPNRTQDGG